jgi:Flp pilus assembly protein TadD
VLEQAVKLSPDKAEFYNNLASAYYYKKDYKTARGHWAKALEIDPINEKAKENLKTLKAMGE